MNPINKIINDRQSARDRRDPNADICFLALSKNNQPSVRTLVLRTISDDGVTLFVNKTSEKWKILKSNKRAEFLLWFSTVQIQYRIRGIIAEIDRRSIETNWPNRPPDSKYLDHAYSDFQTQSSCIESHAHLLQHINEFKRDNPEDSLAVPDTAAGLHVQPHEIEMLDLNHPSGIHDRRLFRKDEDSWNATQLMP